jgi:hypothetical protein
MLYGDLCAYLQSLLLTSKGDYSARHSNRFQCVYVKEVDDHKYKVVVSVFKRSMADGHRCRIVQHPVNLAATSSNSRALHDWKMCYTVDQLKAFVNSFLRVRDRAL